jgi:hypothetical protein
MKDRESYSSKEKHKLNVIHRRNIIKKDLDMWDVGDDQELAHLESLIEQIEPILNTPFKS